jgi:serine/threonine protein kinase
MVATVQHFGELLLRSGLFSKEAVQALLRRWQAVAIEPASVKSFAAWLVANGQLTAYQADLLAEGKADNFFLDRYKVLDRIGKGRMAGVYRAVHPQLGAVALKVLPPSKARDPELLARFQREARLAVPLRHPNVVRAFESGECRGLHYLAMEYLEGETLDEVLARRGRLTPREAARLAFLTTLGLEHIHQQGLVHRDLKPANMMLTPAPAAHENTLRSMVKILDIGLGRALFDPESKEGSTDLTCDGALLGTPDYLAPEQARDPRRADIRADLYSLGCILYHALAGQPPFADDNLVRQILRHATQEAPPLREVNPLVGDELSRIVATLMAKDPARRYPTPGGAGEALQGFLASA